MLLLMTCGAPSIPVNKKTGILPPQLKIGSGLAGTCMHASTWVCDSYGSHASRKAQAFWAGKSYGRHLGVLLIYLSLLELEELEGKENATTIEANIRDGQVVFVYISMTMWRATTFLIRS